MYGGTIEGNTVGSSNQVEGHEQNDLNNDHDRGGGVCVAGGTFTMEGAATISKNTATDGGVYVGSNATFTMTGGTIGSSADVVDENDIQG